MPIEVKLPALGENVEGGDVVEVHVAPGDSVALEQPLFSVEAEKSTVPIPAPAAGKIAKLLVKKGDHVSTGQPIAVIEDGDGKAGPAAAKREPAAPAAKSEASPAPAERATPSPAAPASAKPQATPAPVRRAPASSDGGVVHAGPATRRLAREWGIDLAQVPVTG